MGNNQNNRVSRFSFLFILLIILMGVFFFSQNGQKEGSVTYKQFKSYVEKGKVTDVEIYQNRSVPTGRVMFTVSGKEDPQTVYVPDVSKVTSYLDSHDISYKMGRRRAGLSARFSRCW